MSYPEELLSQILWYMHGRANIPKYFAQNIFPVLWVIIWNHLRKTQLMEEQTVLT